MTFQVVSELAEKTDDSKGEDDKSVYCPEEESSVEDETIENCQSSRDATVEISLRRKISLSIIAMGKTRAILSFQDPENTSVNWLVFIGDKLWLRY